MKYLKEFESITITISSPDALNNYYVYVTQFDRDIKVFKETFDMSDGEVEEVLFLDTLRDKIHIGEYFDWKEEKAMNEYIERIGEDNYFFYNSYVGGDGWQVIYSEIKIKNAENITDNKASAKKLEKNRKIKQFDL